MVGDRKRREVVDSIKETARDALDKAGGLLGALFALAAAAMVLALGVFVFALRTRPRAA